jgi:ubiquinone/menaquinone biosynthesis C-methylase UbiE
MSSRRERWMRRLIPNAVYHQHRYAQQLDASVPDGARWLDIGAGTRLHGGWEGPSQETLAGRASVLIGCDFVTEHLRENPFLDGALAADAGSLPFADGSFDVVTANMVLEHLDNPVRVFSEVRRVLAPGGRFIFVTPNLAHPVVYAFSTLLSRKRRKRIAQILENREDEHIFMTHYLANTPRRVRELAASSGLEAEIAEPFWSWPLTYRKAWPLFLAECGMIAVSRGPLRRFASNLVGVLRRPAASLPPSSNFTAHSIPAKGRILDPVK